METLRLGADFPRRRRPRVHRGKLEGFPPVRWSFMESAPLQTISFTAFHVFLLVLAGVGAGVFNGVAGGGSLISFPVLLALGLPPLTANITNTIGIWPGYLGGAAGFRHEISDQTDRFVRLGPVAGLGAVAGAALLLTTPSADFT